MKKKTQKTHESHQYFINADLIEPNLKTPNHDMNDGRQLIPMSGAEDDDSRRIGPRRRVSGISRRGSNESQGFAARSSDDLYELCEAILSDSNSKDDQTVASRRWSNDGSSTPSAEEQIDPSEVWKPVRFWLAQNLSLQHRRVAALKRGTFETTALHLVTQHKDPPIDIISALISAAPETASLPDANGW